MNIKIITKQKKNNTKCRTWQGILNYLNENYSHMMRERNTFELTFTKNTLHFPTFNQNVNLQVECNHVVQLAILLTLVSYFPESYVIVLNTAKNNNYEQIVYKIALKIKKNIMKCINDYLSETSSSSLDSGGE